MATLWKGHGLTESPQPTQPNWAIQTSPEIRFWTATRQNTIFPAEGSPQQLQPVSHTACGGATWWHSQPGPWALLGQLCVYPCVSNNSVHFDKATTYNLNSALQSNSSSYLQSGASPTPTNPSLRPVISCHRRLCRVTLLPPVCRLQPVLNSSEIFCLQQELPPVQCHIFNTPCVRGQGNCTGCRNQHQNWKE